MPIGIRLEGCIPCFGRLHINARSYNPIGVDVDCHSRLFLSILCYSEDL